MEGSMKIPIPGSYRRFRSPKSPLAILVLDSVTFLFIGMAGTFLFQVTQPLDFRVCIAVFLLMAFVSCLRDKVRLFQIPNEKRILERLMWIRSGLCMLFLLTIAIFIIRRTIAA